MVEVVFFGKGYGESILLHINDKWFVIDSFIEPKSKAPIALKYLSDNGYGIEDISGIICSHWDNDHVAGISQIIEQHTDGLSLCLPIAYNDKRFTEYIAFNSNGQSGSTSEFLKVLKLIGEKKVNCLYAISERNLFHKEINDSSVCIKALSPNDQQFRIFLDAISLPTKGQKKKIIPLEENQISVVTYVKTCLDSILMGGDMENSTYGWDSICNDFIDEKCYIFKIPHHGSQNGFNRNVWKTMVEKPISVVTRFNASHLPTNEMIKSIARESSAVYVVGPRPKRDRNTMNQARKYGSFNAVQSISMMDYEYGYVKLSKDVKDSDWSIEIFGAVEKY